MGKRTVVAGMLAGITAGTLSSLAAGAPAGTTTASGALEEVVVTAERRSADVQKTAVSVAVLDGDRLAEEGKSTLGQYLENVAGVTVSSVVIGTAANDNPGNGIVIRGVTPDSVLPGDTGVATTALYADGVYQGLGGTFDVDRVEVLRGPQGTLYGRSATSGVVSIYTRDPVIGRWGADGNLEYGSYALRHVSGAVNIPLGPTLSLRVAGNTLAQDSFLDGSRHAGAYEVDAGRAKLLWQPSESLSLLLGAAVQGNITGQGGASAQMTGPNTITITQGPTADPVTSTMRQYWGRLNWDLGIGTLSWQPALRTFDSNSPSIINAVPVFIQSITNQYNEDRIHTEEVRLASNAGSRVTWIAGVWYYQRDYDYDSTVTWEPSGGFSHEPHVIKTTRNSAAFGEATFPLAETWRLTGGVRMDHTRTDSQKSTYTFNLNEGSCNGTPFTPGVCTPYGATLSDSWSLPNDLSTYTLAPGAGLRTQNNFTYKLRIEKDLSPTNLLYAMASSGFLPGDLSVAQSRESPTSAPAIVAFNYAPETLHSWEVGDKIRFSDERFQVNSSAYYYDYSGYQAWINLGNGMSPYFVVASSPAKVLGGEVEALWQLSGVDRIGLSAGYTDARFVDKPTLFASYVAQDRIPGVAPLTIHATYDHRIMFGGGSMLNAGGDVSYLSSYDEGSLTEAEMASLQPYVHVGGQVIGNLRATWTAANGRYSIGGYVRNVGNTVYKTGVNDTLAVTPSAPRVYGVTVHASIE